MDFGNTIFLCCSLGCVAPETSCNTDSRAESAVTISPSPTKLTKGTPLLLQTVFCALPLVMMGSWPSNRVLLLREGYNQVFEPTSVEITDAWETP